MAFSYNDVGLKKPGDTIIVNFPFISRDHVKVYADDVEVPQSRWLWLSNGLIEASDGFPYASKTRVRRLTPEGELSGMLAGTSVFTYETVNNNFTRLLYILQEKADAEFERQATLGHYEGRLNSVEARWIQFVEEGGVPGPPGSKGPIGDAGPQGPIGPSGPRGPQGPQGVIGPSGPSGPTGGVGPTGERGPAGFQGPSGVIGPKGPEGPTGPTGERGPVGPQGPSGVTGPQGSQGIVGPTGPQGSQGITGPQGPQGPEGPIGKAFEPNAQGLTVDRDAYNAERQGFSFLDTERGIIYWKLSNDIGVWSLGVNFGRGPQGLEGPQGPQGVVGPEGQIGPVGPEGPQGPQGIVGPVGPQGAEGAKGATGPQGIKGETGQAGPQGPEGPVGAKGSTGPQGGVGPQGPQGPQGQDGPEGSFIYSVQSIPTPSSGRVGDWAFSSDENRSVYEKTADDIWTLRFTLKGKTGDIGPVGPIGEKGPQGIVGPVGPVGPQGPQGSEASVTGQAVKSAGAVMADGSSTMTNALRIGNSIVHLDGNLSGTRWEAWGSIYAYEAIAAQIERRANAWAVQEGRNQTAAFMTAERYPIGCTVFAVVSHTGLNVGAWVGGGQITIVNMSSAGDITTGNRPDYGTWESLSMVSRHFATMFKRVQ